jgi:hypothetical protein
LTPATEPAEEPREPAWYTPAYFSGHVLVNRRTGTVDHFRLGVPTDKALNVHLTLAVARPDGRVFQAHDIVRVEHMELTGGDEGLVGELAWTEALSPAEADLRLAKVFYKSLEIDWVPYDRALAQARSRDRPLFVMVSWGALDDQSC